MDLGEKFNTYSHLAGTVLAVPGAIVLIVLGIQSADIWKIISFSIYGVTLVLMYGISTVYHGTHGTIKKKFRVADHNAIYLLIAGTYTPFTLVSLREQWGWPLFGVVWSLAAAGMLQEFLLGNKTRTLSLVIYVLMGWVALVAIAPLVKVLGWAGFLWVAAGGMIYTLGIIFYLYDKKFKHWHGIWHLFVIGGSVAHYYAILRYVA